MIGSDNLIKIFGPQVKEADQVWQITLDWMGAPSEKTNQSGATTSTAASGGASGGIGMPGVLQIGGSSQLSKTTGDNSSQTNKVSRTGLVQVVREIAVSDFVIFIDDFHYMDRDLQRDVTKQIKAGAEQGLKICIASVPHHSDDVVRANPELRGRVQAIDMNYWTQAELADIGRIGFPLLKLQVEHAFIMRLAREACGSPQLMQSLCLQTCYRLDVFDELSEVRNVSLDDQDLRRILEATATQSDFSTLVEDMHRGPKIRGQERRVYDFSDGTKGDVYRCVLLAIAADPPTMTLPYSQLISRVQDVCSDSSPVGSSVSEACIQIDRIAGRTTQTESDVGTIKPIEWDTSSAVETIHVADPYFLFYLRASKRLAELGR